LDEKGNKLILNPDGETIFIVTDIDYFKKVNDEYGHSAGDKVLTYIAKTIEECIRSSDYLIRWGGEEFVIILPDCNIEKAKGIAERIRSAIEHGENPVCPVTISMGISRYDGQDYHITINNADKALYYAKSHGRNKVVVYDDIQQENDILQKN